MGRIYCLSKREDCGWYYMDVFEDERRVAFIPFCNGLPGLAVLLGEELGYVISSREHLRTIPERRLLTEPEDIPQIWEIPVDGELLDRFYRCCESILHPTTDE